MRSFNTVEDYLEVLSGRRDLNDLSSKYFSYVWDFAPIISLARYDVAFLDNVTHHTMCGTPLTDRQAELAVKLVLKYTRQLSACGIDTSVIKTPRYRHPLRTIDRSRRADYINGDIHIRFPYDQKLITEIRDLVSECHGSVKFDKENKVWIATLSEYNVNWCYSFAQRHDFEIDPEIKNFMDQILECEKTGHSICLAQDDSQFVIKNSSTSLQQYIHACGGFGPDNLVALVDLAPVCAYEVPADIKQHMINHHTAEIAQLMFSREFDFMQDPRAIEHTVTYARLTNRFPIVVYDPKMLDMSNWTEHFPAEETMVIRNQRPTPEDMSTKKLIYTSHALKQDMRLPLLVSYVGLMVGSSKQIMTARAEKKFFISMKLG
jgi:hypothetical protein